MLRSFYRTDCAVHNPVPLNNSTMVTNDGRGDVDSERDRDSDYDCDSDSHHGDKKGKSVVVPTEVVEQDAGTDDDDHADDRNMQNQNQDQNHEQRPILFSLLGADMDVFDKVLEFLDTRSLTKFDGCCRSAVQTTTRIWTKICQERISTVSRARADLDAMMMMAMEAGNLLEGGSDVNGDGDETAMSRTKESKRQVILYERLRSFCHKIESLYLDLITTGGDNKGSQDITSEAASASIVTERPQNTSSSCSVLSDYFDPQVFREPEAFLFYVKMTSKIQCRQNLSSSFSALSVTPASTSTTIPNSRDDNSTYMYMVHWEGLVSALDQDGWGTSSILFFHLRELGHKLRWTPEIEQVLQYRHGDRHVHSHSSIDNPEYQDIVKKAFESFSLVMVAIPKNGDYSPYQSTPSASRPRLVVASNGHQFVSHDNRIYFHIPSKQYNITDRGSSSTSQAPETASASVYPRLVTSEAIDHNSCGELFGIRIVCNIDDGHGSEE